MKKFLLLFVFLLFVLNACATSNETTSQPPTPIFTSTVPSVTNTPLFTPTETPSPTPEVPVLHGTETVLTGEVLGLSDFDVTLFTDASLVERITNPKYQVTGAVVDERYTNTIDGQTVDGNIAFKYAMVRNQYNIWLANGNNGTFETFVDLWKSGEAQITINDAKTFGQPDLPAQSITIAPGDITVRFIHPQVAGNYLTKVEHGSGTRIVARYAIIINDGTLEYWIAVPDANGKVSDPIALYDLEDTMMTLWGVIEDDAIVHDLLFKTEGKGYRIPFLFKFKQN